MEKSPENLHVNYWGFEGLFCDKTEGIKFRDDIERSELKNDFTSKKRFGQKILKVLSNHLLIQSHSVKVN